MHTIHAHGANIPALGFGTFRMPEGKLPQDYGKDEATMPKEIAGQLAYPFRR